MALLSDNQLVEQIKEGNILAFEELVRRYQRRLLSFAYRITHDEQAAEDVVMEALFNLYKTIDHVDTTRKFSSYIYSIAKNTAISFLRKQKHEVSLDETIIGEVDETMYEHLAREDERDRIARAVKTLDKRYQNVIDLYYFKDLSYVEVGKKLHIPINTVRTHLLRAKEALKKVLDT